MKWSISFILIFLILQTKVQSQTTWQVNFYDKQHHLPNIISDINTDKYGYLWLATTDGAFRFDGSQFKKFDFESPIAKKIILDNNRDVWIISDNIHKLNYKTGKPDNTFIIQERVSCVCQYADDTMLISTDSSMYFLNTKNSKVDTIVFDSKSDISRSFYCDRNKNIWFVTSNQIQKARYDKTKLIFNKQYFFGTKRMNQIQQDRKGDIWLNSNNGLVKYYSAEDTFKKVIFKDPSVNLLKEKILLYLNDTCWYIHGNNLLFEFNPLTEKIQKTITLKSGNKSLENISIRFLFADGFNNFWIASNYGFGKISIGMNNFQSGQIFQPETIDEPIGIRSMAEMSDNKIMLGTNFGMYIYDLNTNTYNKLPKFFKNNYIDVSTTSIKKINNEIYAAVGKGLTIIDFRKKIIYYAPAVNDYSNKGIAAWSSWSIDFDSVSNDLWIGTSSGISRTNISSIIHSASNENSTFKVERYSGLFTHYLQKNDTSGLLYNFVYQLKIQNELLWISAKKNICVYNTRTNKFCFSDKIPARVILPDKQHAWVGTEGLGLLYVHYDSVANTIKTLKVLDKETLFPSNVVWGILKGINHDIWISTTNGLVCLNTLTNEFIVYDQSRGLLSHEFTRNGFASGKNNLYFAGNTGFNYFDPFMVKKNSTIPLPLITGLKVHNKSVVVGEEVNGDILLYDQIESTKTITLRHYNNNFAIGFNALIYSIPEKILYAYRLSGFDNKWYFTDATHREAFYMNLPAGKYLFEVKAANEDAIWVDKPVSLEIIILPPFWNTWWFRLMIVLLILILAYAYSIFRTKKIQKHNIELSRLVKERTKEVNEQKEELELHALSLSEKNNLLTEKQNEITEQKNELVHLNATKDKILSIIGHDLKNPFYAISLSSSLIIENFDSMTHQQLKEFLAMINSSSNSATSLLENLLQWARNQTGKIEFKPEQLSMNSIYKEVLALITIQANKKKISINVDDTTDISFNADKNMILTILRNLISNAIKFTPEKGSIWIHSCIKDGNLCLSVKDNGIGMSKDTIENLFKLDDNKSTEGTAGETGTGLGLAVSIGFAQQHNGTIVALSEENKGSEFILSLPYLPTETGSVIDNEKVRIASTDVHEVVHDTLEKLKNISLEKTYLLDGSYEILVVDDISTIRENIAFQLQRHFIIHQANNGEEGIRMATEKIPDLIISDVMMPGLNGLELALALKNNEKTSHIPIILLTARHTEQNIIEGIRTGADDYIVKPFNLNILEEKVINLLHNRNKLKETIAKKLLIEPNHLIIESSDEKLLKKAIEIIDNKMHESTFTLEQFEKQIGLSRPQLYRKMKALTGYSPIDLLRTLRLKRAAQILKESDKQVNEIAYTVGFNDPIVFRKHFKLLFGVAPNDFRK